MALLISGDFTGKAVKAEFGDDKNGKPKIRIDMQIIGGEHDGKRCPYDGKLSPDNIKYTKAAMRAVGWRGDDVTTFASDVEKAALVVPFTTEVANFKRDDGSISEWTAVRKIGGAPPLVKIADKKKIADVNKWFAEVVGDDSATPF